MRDVSWTELKKYSDDLGAPIIWSESTQDGGVRYDLAVSHKGLAWTCVLLEGNNDSEITEFETDYKGTIVELRVSDEVDLLTEMADYFVPPTGSKVVIIDFHAEGAFKADAACKLLWDYNESGEQPLWTAQGTSNMPGRYIIPTTDTDGVKKLAVSCDNGTLGSLLMSAYAKILVIDNG